LFPQHSVRIDVSKSFISQRPLLFRWVITDSKAEVLSLTPVNVVWNVQSQAEVQFIKAVSSASSVMTVWREEFQLGEASRVEFVTYSAGGDGLHLESRAVRLPKNSSWTSLVMDLGGRYSRFALSCHLEGEGAQCRTLGAIGLTGSQIS